MSRAMKTASQIYLETVERYVRCAALAETAPTPREYLRYWTQAESLKLADPTILDYPGLEAAVEARIAMYTTEAG